jgi:hypothetical protein
MAPERLRLADVLTVSAWSAVVFGWFEGVLLSVSRAWPAVLAPYKASPHVIWIAPVVDLAVFALSGVIVWLAISRAPGRIRARGLTLVLAWFVFAGVTTLFFTLRLLHLAAVVVLALGAAVAVARAMGGREAQAVTSLRRRLLWLPIVLVVSAGATLAWEWASERYRAANLPPVAAGRVP